MKIACITPDSKRDYLCETVLEGFNELGHELIVSDPGNGFCELAMADEEFVTAANNSHILLVFFGKQRNNRSPRRYLIDQVKLPKSRIAYIDGSEWSYTGWEGKNQATSSLVDPSLRRGEPWIDKEMLQRCGWYFKRECYPQDIQHGIMPLPFAMCNRHIIKQSITERDIDIFCAFGHEKTGLRREVNQFMTYTRDNQDINNKLNIVVKSGLNQDQYKDHLLRSKVVIDAWGGGDTNDRMWEAIGSGALILYQRHNVITHNPLIDWVHAASYTNISELSNVIDKLFSKCNVTEIANNGLIHALTYHKAKHRAEEILKYVVS